VSLKRGAPPDLLPSRIAPVEQAPQARPQAQIALLRAKMEMQALQVLQA
jgi:hypothetical protein